MEYENGADCDGRFMSVHGVAVHQPRVGSSFLITYSSLSPSFRISPGHAVTPFTLVTPDSRACFLNQLKSRLRPPTHIVFNRPVSELGTEDLE
jgi:hypothetical protein